jgi:predicted O-methyltransferase YrrM
MTSFSKVVRGHESHITRFHSERGELMHAGAWLRLPVTARERLTGRYLRTPWIVPAAVSYLSRLIQPGWSIFEFGSGWSTPWLATRCAKLFSLEYDPAWYARIKLALEARGLDNCLLLMVGRDDFATTITAFPDESFDLVLVDGQDERVGCVESAAPKLKRGGLLVLDDSDRPEYRRVDRVLESWPRRVFIGLKPYPLTASETAIYRRPG